MTDKKKDSKKEKKEEKLPKVHPDLAGLDINVNTLGEVNSNFSIDKNNEFLNKNVEDKKLANRKNTEKKSSKKKDK